MLIIRCWSSRVTTLSVRCWRKVYTVGWLCWRCISEVLWWHNIFIAPLLQLQRTLAYAFLFACTLFVCFCFCVCFSCKKINCHATTVPLAFSDAHKRSDKVCVCAIFFPPVWLGGVGRLALFPAVSSYWFETCPLSLFPRSRRVCSLIPSPCLSSPLSSLFPRHHVAIGYATAELAACSCVCVRACPRGCPWAREIKHDTCSFQA